MLKLKQTHPAGGDCTAPYDVEMDCPYTVGEFIKEILSKFPGEWGNFEILSGWEHFRLAYADGKLQIEAPLPVQISEMKVSEATAAGGYSRMDYKIKVGPSVEKTRYPFDGSCFHGPKGNYLAVPNPMWLSDTFVWGEGFLIKYNSWGEIEEVLEGDVDRRSVVPVKAGNIRPASPIEIAALKQSVRDEFGIEMEDCMDEFWMRWREPIPPFHGRIIDVDYVEVDLRITDPAHLLSEHSMTPYYIEERRREDMHNGIASLIEDIARLLVKFGRNGLHMPLGVGKCPYGWEQLLYDGILEAFGVLTDEIQAALSKFKNAAVVESWILYEGFGRDEDGILQFINDHKKAVLREIIKNDFIYDILHIDGNCAPDDDLPF